MLLWPQYGLFTFHVVLGLIFAQVYLRWAYVLLYLLKFLDSLSPLNQWSLAIPLLIAEVINTAAVCWTAARMTLNVDLLVWSHLDSSIVVVVSVALVYVSLLLLLFGHLIFQHLSVASLLFGRALR